MQTESGPGESNGREEANPQIGAALDGLSDDELEQLKRLAEEHGMTVEELLAKVVSEGIEQSTRSWLSDLWKEYFSGLKSLFKRSDAKAVPAPDDDSGQPGGAT